MINIEVFKQELKDKKVAVFDAKNNSWRSIPVALTPTKVSRSEWHQLEIDASHIMKSFLKVNQWLKLPEQSRLRNRLFQGLSGFELSFLESNPEENWGHVTIRMDLYWHEEKIHVIEVNCTIPAMQAYSDNVYNAWKTAGGCDENTAGYMSMNVAELLDSLIAMYRRDGGRLAKPRIIILHRDGDSQLGELLHIKNSWNALGFETILATPHQLQRRDDVWLVDETPYDVVYRHIFSWRLEEGHLLDALKCNRQAHIYNPVSAHFESKAFLALVSQIAHDEHLHAQVGFSQAEVRAIQDRVPWSRILGAKKVLSHIENTLSPSLDFRDVESQLDGLVIKRSVGYGGHQVIMGSDWFTEEVQQSLRALSGLIGKVAFRDFATWAESHDSSLWIAQKRLSGAQRKTPVLVHDEVEIWDAWYDASIFINTRTPSICRGGVSRIAKNAIVNIGTGGGLAPFILSDFESRP